ncbi:hypothetical protein ABT160_22215 [Streptomyces sp. NPDC001941]|uniref:hypothetical protein n=1 Tax=Streptomyces sp. NPDC001941 TaxID=3154659 RepID=UPI00333075E1
MTTAQHVAAIELHRTRAFPAREGRSDMGDSGPGYHVVELDTGEDEFWDDESSRWEAVHEQYEAEREALALVLERRWGPPDLVSLYSTLTRSLDGEEIPEPWAVLCCHVVDLQLWRVEGRWIAVGVSQWDRELPFRLLAVITEVDPP